jgi:hypothetical protein
LKICSFFDRRFERRSERASLTRVYNSQNARITLGERKIFIVRPLARALYCAWEIGVHS